MEIKTPPCRIPHCNKNGVPSKPFQATEQLELFSQLYIVYA